LWTDVDMKRRRTSATEIQVVGKMQVLSRAEREMKEHGALEPLEWWLFSSPVVGKQAAQTQG
jgi:hypothetical protein